MEKKELTPEQQVELAKIKEDLERDRQAEINHDEVLKWMSKAREVTPDTLQSFLKSVRDDIPLSYGNICHKIAIAALAAAYSFENSDQGGITGFQSGAVMWDFVCAWTSDYEPQRFVKYNEMLYPQYEYKFTSISPDTWKWLQEEAAKKLKESGRMHPGVKRHMEEIVAGKVPFGYTVEDR